MSTLKPPVKYTVIFLESNRTFGISLLKQLVNLVHSTVLYWYIYIINIFNETNNWNNAVDVSRTISLIGPHFDNSLCSLVFPVYFGIKLNLPFSGASLLATSERKYYMPIQYLSRHCKTKAE